MSKDTSPAPPDAAEQPTQPYRVLARKYRPSHFDELVGQDPLVRTLKNAISGNRIAHAYMLTGIRGTGKTTTARIIARALNYTGPDGTSGPTIGPTDDCEHCLSIADDRHPDVLEIDAASHTGVENIRDILDGVRYAPASARYKVYIIDEVHMLSQNAFNALLKTLEEPPPHVIFIFATTEIHKVPITILSRCQRFDLRRVDVPTLAVYYKSITYKESVEAEDSALRLIAQAADGSVRDGLSLLDQAISLANGPITEALMIDMLGLADRTRTLDLLENALSGKSADALTITDQLYRNGADMTKLMQDMLESVHKVTRLKALKAHESRGFADMAPMEAEKAQKLANQLSMPSLGRAWQIILKGLQDLRMAPDTMIAAEMIIIRLAYAANLPDPVTLIEKLEHQTPSATAAASAVPAQKGQSAPQSAQPTDVASAKSIPSSPPSTTVGNGSGNGSSQASAALQEQTGIAPSIAPDDTTRDITDIETMQLSLSEAGHILLASQLFEYVRPVKIKAGLAEIALQENAPANLPSELGKALKDVTGAHWMVSLSADAGEPTLAERARAANEALMESVKTHPTVAKIIEFFPQVRIDLEKKESEDT